MASSAVSVSTYHRDNIVYDFEKDFIGEGEFGEVFRAHLAEENKIVAVKVLRTPQRLKESQINSLMKEATILQQIGNHPNIVRLLGVCIHPKHYAVILEYCDCNLDLVTFRYLDKFPLIRRGWACRMKMAQGIACGMNYLHEHVPPIIHRDLKSSNILVNVARGEDYYLCKISDFGFAKMRGISSQTTIRPAGRNFLVNSREDKCSTLPFIAPERFLGDSDMTEKVDIYGFAIILWQLKELKRPYATDKEKRVIVREDILDGKRLPLSHDDGAPAFLHEIIEKCWVENPKDRLSFKEIVDCFRLHGCGDEKFSTCGDPLISPHESFSPRTAAAASTCESLVPFRSNVLPVGMTSSTQVLSGGTSSSSSSFAMPPLMPNQLPPQLFSSLPRSSVHQKSPSPPPQPDSHSKTTSFPIVFPSPPLASAVRDAVAVSAPAERPSSTCQSPQEHVMIIKQQWKPLLDSLDPDPLVDVIYTHCSQMTSNEMEVITSLPTRLERAKRLLYFLQSHGPDVYSVFLLALREKQTFLYDILAQTRPNFPSVSHDSPYYQPFDRSGVARQAGTTSGIASAYHPTRDQILSKLSSEETMSETKDFNSLDQISTLLGHHWRRVGRHLGLEEAILQNIEADYKTSQQEQGYQVLLKWCRGKGRERTRTVLYDAIAAVDSSILDRFFTT